MARPKQYVSKSEIAKELGVSKGRVTQLVKAGMPVQADGRIGLDKARKWYAANIRPQVKPAQRPKPPAQPASPAVSRGVSLRDLFERLIGESGRVPEILAAAGVRDPVALACAVSVFVDLVFGLAGPLADVAYDWGDDDDRGEEPKTDMVELARKHGLRFDPDVVRVDFATEDESAAERFLVRFDEALAAALD